jgi:hypothetical protein
MKDKKSPWYLCGFVVLFIGAVLFSDGQTLFSIGKLWDPAAINKDAASMWNNRLEGLRADLPDQGQIGYLSEIDIPGMAFDIVDTNEEYVLTQYFLAPNILIRGRDFPYVVGNFTDAEIQEDSQLETLTGLKVLASYGEGIYLLGGEK